MSIRMNILINKSSKGNKGKIELNNLYTRPVFFEVLI